MTDSAKRKTLILLFLSAVMIAVLAAGLPQLKFQDGLPLPSLEGGGAGEVSPEEALTGGPISPLLKALAVFVVVAILVSAFVQLFKGVSWKEMVTASMQIGFVALLISAILFFMLNRLPAASPAEIPEIVIPEEEAFPVPLGAVPPALFWLVGIILALIVALLGLRLAISARTPVPPARRLVLEAERARLALLSGQDLKSVILRCYREMCLALWQGQGIERDAFMTAREFESSLADQGFPPGPVHQLTRLFEAVRYGRWQPGAGDEQAAVACLEAIVQHSREQARAG